MGLVGRDAGAGAAGAEARRDPPATRSGADRREADPLVAAMADLARCRTTSQIARVVNRACRRILTADGVSLGMVEGHNCHFVEEEGLSPGWKGRRIPLDSCLCGEAVRSHQPIVVPDVKADVSLTVAPYWSTAVAGLTAVPISGADASGVLIAYWARTRAPSREELVVLRCLADAAALAIDNVALRASVDRQVEQRTADLKDMNQRLLREIAERKRAEDEVRHLSLVDELTGLYNRRGFMLLAGRELKSLQRNGRQGLVLYFDLDGLKAANDSRGHEAGDRLLTRAAAALRSVTRETDVAARLGGDEFAVFMTLGYDHPPIHLIVERYLEVAKRADVKWSIGATATPQGRVVSLDDLLAGADEAMYRGRRARRGDRPRARRPNPEPAGR